MGGINKRAHLISCGQEQIWAKGYDLCSIKDITSAAKLPKGSFYHYFESKEKFALEAMNEFIDTFQEEIPEGEFSIASLEQLIDARVASIIQINFARECYMSVMCHAYTNQEEAFRLEVLAAIEKSNEAMRQLLTILQAEKLIDNTLDLDELMEFIDFAWRGARLKARLEKSRLPLHIFKKYLFKLIIK